MTDHDDAAPVGRGTSAGAPGGAPPAGTAGEGQSAPPQSAPAQSASAQSASAQSAEEIRAQIEATREQLGDTVEALAAKTDVKARAQDRVNATRQNLSQLRDDTVARVRQATPNSAASGVAQVGATAQANPLPFAAAGAFVAGLFLGWLLRRR